MSFSPGDDVLIIPKIDTGKVAFRDPVINGKYSVTCDRKNETKGHFQGELKKLPLDGTFVNTRAFSYKVTATVSNGVRSMHASDFAYRYDGVSHRGGRIRI